MTPIESVAVMMLVMAVVWTRGEDQEEEKDADMITIPKRTKWWQRYLCIYAPRGLHRPRRKSVNDDLNLAALPLPCRMTVIRIQNQPI